MTAKRLIAAGVKDFLAGHEGVPTLRLECEGSGFVRQCDHSVKRPLKREKVDQVELEFPVGSRRLDVALLNAGKVVLGVEVLATHAVDERKGADLPVAWIELEAKAILEDPLAWNPVQWGRMTAVRCAACAELGAEGLRKALRDYESQAAQLVQVREIRSQADLDRAIWMVTRGNSLI